MTRLLRSNFVKLLILFMALLLCVFWPITPKPHVPLSGVALQLKQVSEQCEAELLSWALLHEAEWEEGAAQGYCFCVASRLLLHNESEEEIEAAAAMWLSERELFRLFIRSEQMVEQCEPDL